MTGASGQEGHAIARRIPLLLGGGLVSGWDLHSFARKQHNVRSLSHVPRLPNLQNSNKSICYLVICHAVMADLARSHRNLIFMPAKLEINA